jgi:hypothetical protein
MQIALVALRYIPPENGNLFTKTYVGVGKKKFVLTNNSYAFVG